MLHINSNNSAGPNRNHAVEAHSSQDLQHIPSIHLVLFPDEDGNLKILFVGVRIIIIIISKVGGEAQSSSLLPFPQDRYVLTVIFSPSLDLPI